MPAVTAFTCPACHAPIPPDTTCCPYCASYLVTPDAGPGSAGTHTNVAGGVVFQRRAEPNEHAFTLSVPHGWQLSGGIVRAGGQLNAQMIEAKLDFTVMADTAGTVAIRWCPEVKYADLRGSPAAMFGLFPQGSLYQGMVVMPLLSPGDFITRVVLPWARPAVTDLRVMNHRQEPLLVQIYRDRMAALGFPASFPLDGAIVHLAYTDNGSRYEEKAYTVIESLGALGRGMWSNKDTLLLRAPEGELDRWEPLLHHVRESVQLDRTWLAREIASQEMLGRMFLNAQQAEIARNRRMLEIQQHMQQVDRQITEHRAKTHAEIHNDAYLTLMQQEEYVNPHTNEVEVGSNQWRHRWVTGGGEEFYTDSPDDDPNIAGVLNSTDWRPTPLRKRFGS